MNIPKLKSVAASDDIGGLENPERNSWDLKPDYIYFSEIPLTDLYSIMGIRKDLHEDVPPRGNSPLCMC